MAKKRVLIWILGVVIGLILFLFFVRFFGYKEVDDISPGIFCNEKLMEKADVLWIIPKFEGKNVSEDKEWCSGILAMNKKLGLHGVYHSYKEFNEDRSEEYLAEGVSEFEKCFGYKTGEFKAPQLALSRNNVRIIENKGLSIKGWINQITHKVYHCNDSGKFPNWVIDLI